MVGYKENAEALEEFCSAEINTELSQKMNSYLAGCLAVLCDDSPLCKRTLFIKKQDAYHRRKHESRIRTSTALIAREINMRELKQNSQHFS